MKHSFHFFSLCTAVCCISVYATSKSAVMGFSAVRGGDASQLASLLDHGLFINSAEESSGQTLLMAATLAGQADIVELLLSRGADATIGERQGYTPPHGAGFQGRASVVLVLARHGIDLNQLHSDGFSGFHRALWGAEARHTDTAAAFIDAGVDMNQRASDGSHPLDITRNEKTKQMLLARGASKEKTKAARRGLPQEEL
jgi:ankyrin repeat protein